MDGKVLFMAVGTGIDIRHFPAGGDITAIDISAEMLHRAMYRQRTYQGTLRLVRADALDLPFVDAAFDTVVTSCTMCSVPDPVRALCEIHRVLGPGGRLLMFEHVRSRNLLLGLALDAMTLWTRVGGTEMNRDTLKNIRLAGFDVRRIESVYLDIILSIEAVKGSVRLSQPLQSAEKEPHDLVGRRRAAVSPELIGKGT
jgi:ubiquinone/menaquinone biosynthesis C-methylase UbiE